MKHAIVKLALLGFIILTAGCDGTVQSPAPTICGVYMFRTSDTSIHHGVDILVINADSTYVHFYTGGSSGKNLVQDGSWNRGVGSTIGFSGFIGWDLMGGTPDGVMYPDPASTALPYGQDLNGNYKIDVGPDFDEKFVQIQRFNQ